MGTANMARLRRQGPLLGLGLYWAWVAVVFYSNALAPSGPDAEGLIDTVWLWATWSHMIALFAFALIAPKAIDLLASAPLRGVGAWGCALGTASIAIIVALPGDDGAAGRAVVLALSVLMGAASSLHVLQWAQLYSRDEAAGLALPSFLSFATGLALYFLLALFPAPLLTITAVLLPLFSWLAMGVQRRRSGSAEARARIANADASGAEGGTGAATTGSGGTLQQPFPLPELVLGIAAVFVFALCGEMLRAFTLRIAGAGMNAMGQAYLVGGLIGLAALALYALLPTAAGVTRRITTPVLRFVLVVMAAAFLVAPFLSGYSAPIAYGIFGAGFWCLRAITWTICFPLARAMQTSPVRAIGVLDGTFALSVVISGQLNAWLAEAVKVGAAEMTTVSLIAVFVLMFMAMVVAGGRGLRGVLADASRDAESAARDAGLDDEDASGREGAGKSAADRAAASAASAASAAAAASAASAEGIPSAAPATSAATAESAEARTDALFDRCGLSPREREVASLLARGRSLPFIQSELYISAGTAQTHARHIYKKMGVHSRQELIDKVEKAALVSE